MITAPIDPRTINFRDALNPQLSHKAHGERRPADFNLLESPLYRALRGAAGYVPFLQCVPDGQNVTVLARATYEQRCYVPRGAFLYALTANSPQAAGFTVQITDLGSGRTVFPTAMKHSLISGGTATTQGVRNPQYMLLHPRAVDTPGLLSVQIINKAAVNNALQLALWFIVPATDTDSDQPNAWNDFLDRELKTQAQAFGSAPARALAIGTAAAPPPAPLMSPPWEVMPRDGRPLSFELVAALPAAGTVDFPVISFVVPIGYNAALKLHRHKYLGPGFNEGSGDIIWRILVDGASPPGYDDMRTTAGPDSPRQIPGAIIAEGGQTVQYTVSVGAAVILGDSVLCGLEGYQYPAP